MRILYLHQYFRTPDQAGATRSFEMARRLVDAGHTVLMVTSDNDTGRRLGEYQYRNIAGIDVHSAAVPYRQEMSYPKRIMAFLQFSWYAARKAANLRADVVFATSTPLTIAIPALFAARWQKIPMVFEVRDIWPEVPIAMGAIRNPLLIFAARWLERVAYRNSKQIVALAPGMKESVVATGYEADQVTVIPNGCDLDLFEVDPERGRPLRERHEWLGDRPLAIYTGSLGAVHGVDYLVRLAAAVLPLDPEIRILIIGKGSLKESIRNLAESLGVLDKNLFFMDAIAKKAVPDWLAAADIVCSPICDQPALYKDAVTNKFFDGLAAGKPVMSNFIGWQSEISLENDVGFVTDRHDMNKAAMEFVKAMRDETWRIEAGRRARELARSRFNRDILAAQLESVLLKAVARSERPTAVARLSTG